MNIRQRIWEIVEPAKPGDTLSRTFDIAILAVIFVNIAAVIAGSVPAAEQRYGAFFKIFEAISVALFTAEYLARLWSCVADAHYRQPVAGRLRFAATGMAIIDLPAIAPFYMPFTGIDLRAMRALRLLRLVRVAKVGRYYASLNLIGQVLKAKKEELVLTTSIMAMLLIMSSSVLYFCENEAQPDTFSSIPATMWWAIATLTTVGYGDLYPITLAGKLFASVIAVLGIGMFALPTGILGAGFVEAVHLSKKPRQVCPHCGKEV